MTSADGCCCANAADGEFDDVVAADVAKSAFDVVDY